MCVAEREPDPLHGVLPGPITGRMSGVHGRRPSHDAVVETLPESEVGPRRALGELQLYPGSPDARARQVPRPS